ncbi:MAG: M24 family metallopeptidase, partial [Gemmataceae bacterium]|nr:M24 family metallopeptidase [Gemmataceae bacterium]
MLTAEGCRRRRQRLLEQLSPAYPLVLADPIHLRYLAGYHVEAINQHADFGGLLVLTPDGECHLYHDSRLPATTAHADRIEEVVWYDGKSPGQGPRRLLFEPIIRRWGNRVHDLLPDPMAIQVHQAIAALRRCKDEDELTLIQQCLRASEVGHAWACRNLRVGLSELEIYNGLTSAIYQFLGQWAVVYGDFVVSRGGKRGGPPGLYRLQDSDAFILDYSVVLYGYRSDCTNTLICGNVTPRHTALFSACLEALQAGEAVLRAGVTGQQV